VCSSDLERIDKFSLCKKLRSVKLNEGLFSLVAFAGNSEVVFFGVKTSIHYHGPEMNEQELKILSMLNHPLIVRLHIDLIARRGRSPCVVTEFMGNGSLADHLPNVRNSEFCQIYGETRIARVIVGIVLAMRFIHSKNILHCDLTSNHILLDWDWNVRICDFGLSHLQEEIASSISPFDSESGWPSGSAQYLAPERYDKEVYEESDVFSFGLILYEIITGLPAIPKEFQMSQAAKWLILKRMRPDIPNFVLPSVRELICDCWANDPGERPSFEEILDRLRRMRFKVTRNVKSMKISEFVQSILKWEESHSQHRS
jgi:serine/threonine protein kinase